jgi:cysteinyl-tRNA synthetase
LPKKYLGETFDIHCGGVDNIFPHHENEIAQSEAATGKKFVNYWLHNEHLLVEGKRMAKRFGNYYTLRDLLQKSCDPRAIRYLLLSTHYRQQFNFTFEGLEAAKSAIDRLAAVMRRLQNVDGESIGEKSSQLTSKLQACFSDAMDDDLNVSVALASLFDFVRDVNNLIDAGLLSKNEAEQVHSLLLSVDGVLGVVGEVEKEEELSKEAKELIAKREEARKAKDWATADAIRQQLKSLGIIIEDTAQGVRWRIEKP